MQCDVPLTAKRLAHLLDAFARQHVVVVGDMVADEYLFGTPARISREAPVLILEFVQRRLVPGGATNVAANLRALGARVSVVGVIGDDEAGRELRSALVALQIGAAGLIVDPSRPTSTKTRIIGGGDQVKRQQMVRIDRVDSSPLDDAVKSEVLRSAQQALTEATGLILSDYEHGVIDPEVIGACLPRAVERGLTTTVDAHGDFFRFRGVSLATPNQPEAEACLGRRLVSTEALRDGGRALLAGMEAEALLITRGSLGMAVFDRAGLFQELAAYRPAEVQDATGAGDTVAASATLALGGGGTALQAAMIGNIAGGLVVRRFGAATVGAEEIIAAFAQMADGQQAM